MGMAESDWSALRTDEISSVNKFLKLKFKANILAYMVKLRVPGFYNCLIIQTDWSAWQNLFDRKLPQRCERPLDMVLIDSSMLQYFVDNVIQSLWCLENLELGICATFQCSFRSFLNKFQIICDIWHPLSFQTSKLKSNQEISFIEVLKTEQSSNTVHHVLHDFFN